jgi:uncharacterized protein (DUF1800 family)
MHRRIVVLAAWMGAALGILTSGAGAQAPLSLTVSNDGNKTLRWPLVPGLDSQQLKTGQTLNALSPVNPAAILKTPGGYVYGTSNQLPSQFYSLILQQMSTSNAVSANLLNRIAYGPTPDELERLAIIGPDAYIEEQLAPESVPSAIDSYVSAVTNGVPLPPNTNWNMVNVTGAINVGTAPLPFYIYMREAGQVSVDAVDFRYYYYVRARTNNGGIWTTNLYTNLTANLVVNGDFEQALSPSWSIPGVTHTGSYIDATRAASGASSLRVVANGAGTGSGNAILQNLPSPPTHTGSSPTAVPYWTNEIRRVNDGGRGLNGVLNFSYVRTANSRMLTLRTSGDGTVASGRDIPSAPEWIYTTATGVAGTSPTTLYIYLTGGAGESYVDNLKLVAGSVPEQGPNLIANGDFEQPFATGWQATADFDTSFVDTNVSYSGSGSLHIMAENAGSGNGDAIYQTLPVSPGQTYTVSYWYRVPTSQRGLVVRLSTSGGGTLNSSPSQTTPGNLKRRLDNANWGVSLSELRQWFCNNAVGSANQLLEVLTQFFENHFVTQHSKTVEYFDQFYDGGLQDLVATDAEYREVSRWRTALRNPNCTFYDLLKIHVESPAQIIYLDTITSRADGNQVANENYARELFELFAMGVDNGYEQQDIVAMSRAWTGWRVDIVDRTQVDNPHAPRSREYGRTAGVGFNSVSNTIGIWTFSFKNEFHGTNRAPILSAWDPAAPASNPRALGPKRYPARFGDPWKNTSYQLVIPPSRTTPQAAIMDGYDVIRHLSTNLFTAEYLSVKLCRLFVHEDFVHGVYDYGNPSSPEAELIRQCILAWDTPGPGTVGGRGNIRRVIRTILTSDLFRQHGNTLQKVKTPLEYVASAVRALRSMNPDATATATTDGASASFRDPMSNMGGMGLFNRADPDGYPEYGAAWISAGTLAARVRFIQMFLTAGSRPFNDAGNNFANPVALLKKKLPSGSWNDATAVVDYFLGIIYPGEGRANLDQYRGAAIQFLNTSDNGQLISNFSGLGNTSAEYDTRVRGMVSYLMSLQRFHEQ